MAIAIPSWILWMLLGAVTIPLGILLIWYLIGLIIVWWAFRG